MATQSQKSNWRSWLMAPLLLGVALSLAACGNESKKSSNISRGGFAPGCPGCVAAPGANILAAAIGAREDVNQFIELGMRVHAPSSTFPAWSYYGPVTTSGYMMVYAGNWGGCPILPPGRYAIRTLPANGAFAPDLSFQPFNLMNHEFEVVMGGVVARVHVDYAEFYDQAIYVGADGAQYPHRMYGQLRITPMTNVPYCYAGPVNLMFPRPF